MASQPNVLQRCLEKAALAAGSALDRAISQAIATLQTAETESKKILDRDQLRRAWRGLQDCQPSWVERYPGQLAAVFKAQVARVQSLDEIESSKAPDPAQAPQATAPFHQLLALVEDADVSKAIESSRMLQQVSPMVESTLEVLDKLISGAQGLPNIRPDLNPLRLDTFIQTLREIVSAASADAAILALWIRYLTPPFGQELKQIYEQAIQQLKSADIKEASYRLMPRSGARGSAGASGQREIAAESASAELSASKTDQPLTGRGDAGGSAAAPIAHTGWDKPMQTYPQLPHEELGPELFQNFMKDGGHQADYSLPTAYYEAVEEELQFLADMRDSSLDTVPGESAKNAYPERMAVVDRPNRAVNALSHLSEQIWGRFGRAKERNLVRTQLKKKAERVGQVLGLEVVRQLVTHVAQDPRLLAPVREAIVALEPSLLRLAMVDPRFFSDEKHAGRQLMERVALRSFRYNDEFSADFQAFLAQVSQEFKDLNTQDIQTSQPFAQVLLALEGQWQAQDVLDDTKRRDALQTLRFAEERQAQADLIASEIKQRSDLEQVPRLILDFLVGPWALAMAHARLLKPNNSIDPLGLGSVIPDLLWSVKREVILRQPGKLIQMIPGLVGKLNEGLNLIGQSTEARDAFFERLMRLHHPVLNLRRVKTRRDSEESGAMPLEDEELYIGPAAHETQAAEQPWLGREELDAAGFQDTLPTVPGELAAIPEEHEVGLPSKNNSAIPLESVVQAFAGKMAESGSESAPSNLGAAPSISASDATKILQGFHTGDWIDLYSRHKWLRAELVWSSAKGALFMFISQGGQPHSMTKRSCERLIRDRLLRTVSSHGVVEHALNAVITAPRLASAALLSAPPHAAQASAPFLSLNSASPIEEAASHSP